MKVSLSWLRTYVNIKIETPELVHLLTMAGLEVERATPVGEGLEKVIVAEVSSIRRHPNADRLVLVKAKTERETYSIVCGATNLREGLKVPLALPGARLPNGMEIRRSKIRGEASEGMLCSAIELELGQDASGIMILPPELPLGVSLGEALELRDTVFDISITPNRADCLCVMGVAREIAAITGQTMRYPRVTLPHEGEEIHRKTSVTVVDPDLCPRYVARLIEGVTIGPSPRWMRDRLEKVGIRSISNVVDITNFVMMESNQPLHAFDFDLLEERRIVVRRASKGEVFVTLDQAKRILDRDTLMICDGVKPVAIAGIMGGMNSEISENTRTVLLESAYFDPAGNRRTSLRLGLETEASYRFGRGIDYGGALFAADRAGQLIQELAGGRVVEGVVDVYPSPIQSPTISLRFRRANDVLGTNIPPDRMKAYLESLELTVREEGRDRLIVTPPSFRRDLEREIDLIEEIARLDGYDHVPVTLPGRPASVTSEESPRNPRLESKAVEVLLRHGFHEVVTYSFTSPQASDPMGFEDGDPKRQPVRILNPLSEDFSVLRTSLIPGLMETAQYNLSWKNENLKLFEMRKVFLPRSTESLPEERRVLAGLAMGNHADPHWAYPSRPVDFYDIKGVVEDLFDALQVEGVRFSRAEDVSYLHPGKTSRALLGEKSFGVLGAVHPEVLAHYQLQPNVFLFELDLENILQEAVEARRFKPLLKFPAVYRDVSLVLEENVAAGNVVDAIWNFREPLINEVQCFDLYRGAPIPNEKKGVSYRIRYQSMERTLTDEEVNRIHEQVISRLKEIFRAELRV